MSDSEGGSTAARRALEDPDDNGQRGLFGRIIDAFNISEDSDAPHPHGVRRVLPGLVSLRSLTVEDAAVPKAEIVAVPVDIDKAELITTFRESGYSRLPVYDETLDHPLGLLLLKDLALEYGFNGDRPLKLRQLLRPLIYAPPSMPLAVLLQRMQTERTHMALVIDEYGGVDGLVTIEDLLEQVVGEIEDEHDIETEGFWHLEQPGCYLALSRTPLEDFEAEIGLRLADPDEAEEIDTLGGLVFVLAGRVPARGEILAHESGVEFEIVDADPRRVHRLRVRLPETLTGAT